MGISLPSLAYATRRGLPNRYRRRARMRGNHDVRDTESHPFKVARIARGRQGLKGQPCARALRFSRVSELEIAGFSHQNALFDLRIEPLAEPNSALISVKIESAFGVSAE